VKLVECEKGLSNHKGKKTSNRKERKGRKKDVGATRRPPPLYALWLIVDY